MLFTRNRLTPNCPSNRLRDDKVPPLLDPVTSVAKKMDKSLRERQHKYKEINASNHRYIKGGTDKVYLVYKVQSSLMHPIKFLRLPEVIDKVGLCRSTIYDRMGRGTFPKSHKVGPRIVVWNEYELDQWCLGLVK